MPEPATTTSALRQLSMVFVAGGLGASLRVWLVGVLDKRIDRVLLFGGTLIVNLLGCLAIGFLSAILPPPWRPVVLGGLLGGFTTYSAFGLLSWNLLRDGKLGAFTAQISIHLIGGIVCVVLGLWLGKLVVGPERL